MTCAVVAIEVSLSVLAGVGALGSPVNVGDARSALESRTAFAAFVAFVVAFVADWAASEADWAAALAEVAAFVAEVAASPALVDAVVAEVEAAWE